MKRIASSVLAVCACVCVVQREACAIERVDFNRDVRSILSDKCFACHGPDENHREGDLRLDDQDSVFANRDGYSIVKPGSADESELIARVESDDPDMVMPPTDSGKELTPKEISLLRRWVSEGAEWKRHWSFEPPTRPKPPETDSDWATNEIDSFIEKHLNDAGLKPEPIADRNVLARRLHLDLTGLPPSGAELEQFLNDASPIAYERLVDRLLDSPHYGERMALAWLDQARYADTNGYSIDGGRHMWLWRDWVINAYNTNMPFDQFVVEQLAGDLLPNATIDQKVATGFSRNHMITHEGGTIAEENLVNYTADRVRTTAEVFLGLTMGCAQCHDHKFDPITQKDYYRFFAYFNTLEDRGHDGDGGRNAAPRIQATSVLGRDGNEVRDLRFELEQLEKKLADYDSRQEQWEKRTREELETRGKELQLHPIEVLKVTSPNRGAAYDVREDGTVYLPNSSGRSPSISGRLDSSLNEITGLRIVFYPDDKFPNQGIGHGNKDGMKGSLLLTSFSASTTLVPSDQVDLYKIIPIRNVTASDALPQYPATACLDPRDNNGWSPGEQSTPQHITFQFDKPLNAVESSYVTVMLVWGGGHGLTGGKYRVFAMTGNDDGTNVPDNVQAALEQSPQSRTRAQVDAIREHYKKSSPELANLRYQIENLKQRIAYLTDSHPVMVMNVAKKPRQTFVLNRGQYDQPTVPVDAGVPSQLEFGKSEFAGDRLGLARWLIQPEHPLTARVAVNRIWQNLFGSGIVATSADFGSQGDPPSHPELLDWLATEFAANSWNVKAIIKKIVMSSTYRQGSRVSAEKLAADPNNRLLSRGARFRLDAEFVRDAALKTSGLLARRIGGPSVRPYQPFGLWREISHFGSTPATAQAFVQDHGEHLYRRSMYTYWKRTVPPPSMVTFDAPNREVCTIRRSRTNTPLQALVQLNDPQFVEASRAFALRILTEAAESTEARTHFAFREALSRAPTGREAAIVHQLVDRERARYAADVQLAEAHLSIGESETQSDDAVEHAAWTTAARLILNLSESITKS